ncbi:MAG: zinc metalloprotease ywhC [Candidatus Saccharibacteria bacterium]|nr:zinc metalloprotease ywhC [Candidatus Saccharibacteria bacterium]
MFDSITLNQILIVIGVLLVSMTVHEAAHAFAGLKLGDTTAAEEGRISLNPAKHIDPFMTIILPAITLILPPHALIMAAKPVPFNPDRVKWDEFGAALIAAAGPLSNFVLAVVGAGIINYFAPGGVFGDIMQISST